MLELLKKIYFNSKTEGNVAKGKITKNSSFRLSEGAEIKSNCRINGSIAMESFSIINEECILEKKISMGRRSSVGKYSELQGPLIIGSFTSLARDVHIATINHDYNRMSTSTHIPETSNGKEEKVKIGSDVWIGKGSLILPGVEIENGAVVAGGSVVHRDVDGFEIVGGNPIETISYRFEKKKRDIISKSKWWTWSDEKLKSQKELFEKDINEVNHVNLKRALSLD